MNKSLEKFYKKAFEKKEVKEDEKTRLKSVINKNVFQRLGELGISEEKKYGLQSGKLRENCREDLEHRKRLIRIIKGKNYEEAEDKAAVWLES